MSNQRRQSPNTGDEATNEPPISRRLSRISRTESVVSFSEDTVFDRRMRSDSVSLLEDQTSSSSPRNRGNEAKTYPKSCFKRQSTRSTSSTSQTNAPVSDLNNSRRSSIRRMEMSSSNYQEHESPVHKGKPAERQVDLEKKDPSIILDMLIGFEVDVSAPRVRRRSIARRSALSTANHPSDTWSTGDADTDDVEEDCDNSMTKEDEERIFQCSELLSQRIPEDSDHINLASKDQIRRSSKIANAADTRRRHTLNYFSGHALRRPSASERITKRPSFEYSGNFAKVSKSLPNIALWKYSTLHDNERIVTDNANEEFAIDLKSKDEKARPAKRFSLKQTLSFFQKVAEDYDEKKGDEDEDEEENVLLKNLRKIDSNNLLSIYRGNKEDDSSDDE
ncbi:predicted protein [Chaetoceros tenuissimus]|uniref:Uncharacterized protein n=1 Tax=Chaetoceros tenuissimus TaxID=426638 RepID=A0AAD3DBK6_9STRA|nr:predicted protein [Chaetoceros tenuissimus]